MKRNLLNAQCISKYKLGDLVLIDKILLKEGEEDVTIEKLQNPVIAVVEKITHTSSDAIYNLKLLNNSQQLCYHESDILSVFDI
tara:strand:- start:467 stop:718 length:252 start_codon:yes stop_codon:yes gene_type:complete